ncbi:hypothetical protein [Yoonia sp. 208BN28-4]|uniref:hypothetical protein n=1 Tax=Yoonia sp. 208BN28-4 TaxID=3126505 RepID=UPI0030957A48
MRFDIDGATFETLDGFFDVASQTLAPGKPVRRDLNGFDRILRGGLGPAGSEATLVWANSEKSRWDLGYAETLRVLQARLDQVPAPQRAFVLADIANAEAGQGATVYDWVVDVIARHGPGGPAEEDNIRLVLD